MSMFQYIARVITMTAATVLFAAPFAAAEQGGRYWVPTTTEPATPHQRLAAKATTQNKATTQKRARSPLERTRSPLAANARLADSKAHRLILQVNTNDPAAMNLALNNATNVAQYYKDAGEKVKIEVVTFGPGLHMLRDDTSPVKARIEEMALSAPEVSFKACGNTQERMHKAENKDIPIVRQAEVVKSGVVRVMELQEKGWSYVKP
ncbi:DsrE family protein [Bradyrhizobium sp. JYMT SZCCT0428]|uniref:DsrE family protein n=1 Tax=Bradyrhizobium sp. JYMT SZCCT0428 TaxID=2807673 RepID=UPI001BA80A36|nr:DsrE family protein [Bradyrhizobium sp. JYMT SZCCT0428]MBR1155820.1 DsrE family protein [Bradyrhizobium sp. JYMT SZCCT0428]